jgi:hypothetical protein
VSEECDADQDYADSVFGSQFARRSSFTLGPAVSPSSNNKSGDGSSSSSPHKKQRRQFFRSPSGHLNHRSQGSSKRKSITTIVWENPPGVLDSVWNRAMARVDKQSLEDTWDAIVDALNSFKVPSRLGLEKKTVKKYLRVILLSINCLFVFALMVPFTIVTPHSLSLFLSCSTTSRFE